MLTWSCERTAVATAQVAFAVEAYHAQGEGAARRGAELLAEGVAHVVVRLALQRRVGQVGAVQRHHRRWEEAAVRCLHRVDARNKLRGACRQVNM